jgi:hypothetical protein
MLDTAHEKIRRREASPRRRMNSINLMMMSMNNNNDVSLSNNTNNGAVCTSRKTGLSTPARCRPRKEDSQHATQLHTPI